MIIRLKVSIELPDLDKKAWRRVSRIFVKISRAESRREGMNCLRDARKRAEREIRCAMLLHVLRILRNLSTPQSRIVLGTALYPRTRAPLAMCVPAFGEKSGKETAT